MQTPLAPDARQRRQFHVYAFWMIVFALALRFLLSAEYNLFTTDPLWYERWVKGMDDGLFNIYARADKISLDYPPLYLYGLWLINKVYHIFPELMANAQQSVALDPV